MRLMKFKSNNLSLKLKLSSATRPSYRLAAFLFMGLVFTACSVRGPNGTPSLNIQAPVATPAPTATPESIGLEKKYSKVKDFEACEADAEVVPTETQTDKLIELEHFCPLVRCNVNAEIETLEKITLVNRPNTDNLVVDVAVIEPGARVAIIDSKALSFPLKVKLKKSLTLAADVADLKPLNGGDEIEILLSSPGAQYLIRLANGKHYTTGLKTCFEPQFSTWVKVKTPAGIIGWTNQGAKFRPVFEKK